MNFFQLPVGHVRINLGGGDRGVAEHRLHRSDIRAGIQKIGGEAVTQSVGSNFLGNAGFGAVKAQKAFHAPGR